MGAALSPLRAAGSSGHDAGSTLLPQAFSRGKFNLGVCLSPIHGV